jgi:hypothetical protein
MRSTDSKNYSGRSCLLRRNNQVLRSEVLKFPRKAGLSIEGNEEEAILITDKDFNIDYEY